MSFGEIDVKLDINVFFVVVVVVVFDIWLNVFHFHRWTKDAFYVFLIQ